MAKGTNTRKCRNVVSIVRSWPMHVKQVTGEKKNLPFLFLANAGYSCTKAGISQLPGSHSQPNGLASPLPARFLPQEAKMSGQGQHRLGPGKKAVGLRPAVANLARCQFLRQQHQAERCWRLLRHTFTSLIWMKMQILIEGSPRYMLLSIITTEGSTLRQYCLRSLSCHVHLASFVFSPALYQQQSFLK